MGIAVFPAAGGGVTQKVQEFTSTGTFTAPSNCSAVEVFLVGGGGGGGGTSTRPLANYWSAGAGGGGGGVTQKIISVTPGTAYTVTIGAGGAAGSSTAAGAVGGDTTFGSLATAYGGGGGDSTNDPNTYYFGTIRATQSGLAPAQALNNQGYSASGGAGGSGYVRTFTNITYYGRRMQQSTSGPIQGGFGSGMINGSSGDAIGGEGIEGFGQGSVSGSITSDGGHIFIMSGSGAGYGVYRDTNGATNGIAGVANRGGGGSGGAAYTTAAASQTATGGAGGSGYARIIYWS